MSTIDNQYGNNNGKNISNGVSKSIKWSIINDVDNNIYLKGNNNSTLSDHI